MQFIKRCWPFPIFTPVQFTILIRKQTITLFVEKWNAVIFTKLLNIYYPLLSQRAAIFTTLASGNNPLNSIGNFQTRNNCPQQRFKADEFVKRRDFKQS